MNTLLRFAIAMTLILVSLAGLIGCLVKTASQPAAATTKAVIISFSIAQTFYDDLRNRQPWDYRLEKLPIIERNSDVEIFYYEHFGYVAEDAGTLYAVRYDRETKHEYYFFKRNSITGSGDLSSDIILLQNP